jgi:hypothetical protein
MLFFVRVFPFCEIGSGAYPLPPAGAGGGWASESLRLFNTEQVPQYGGNSNYQSKLSNGTRSIRLGPSNLMGQLCSRSASAVRMA